MPYFSLGDGTRLYYEEAGTGRTLLFVHGWTMSHELWDYQFDDLSDRFRTIAVDLRGHGDSDKPTAGFTIAQFAHDLREFVGALGLKDVVLIGWSMGATVALHYADLFGDAVARLVLVDGSPSLLAREGWPHGRAPEAHAANVAALRADHAAYASSFVASMFYKRPSQQTLNWIERIALKTPLRAAIASWNSLAEADNRGIVGRLRLPTLILHGRHDARLPIIAAEYFRDQIPGAQLTVFEESGHCPFIEEAAAFDEHLAAFAAAS